MKSIFIVATKSLRANLRQAVALFTAVFFATLLLVVSLNLFFNLDDIFDKSYVESDAPQVSGMYNPSEVPPELIEEFLAMQNIEKLNISQLYDANYIKANDRRIDMPYVVAVNPELEKNVAPFFINSAVHEPAYGEVFISQKAARMLGVGIGDNIDIYKSNGAVALKVSGIVVDYLHDAPASTLYRIWLNQNQAEKEFEKQTGYYFEGVYKDNIIPDGDVLYKDFTAFTEKEPVGYFYTYEQIKARYTTMLSITSVILFSLSILASITVLVILGFAIKGAIIVDTKKIGILKAVGFSNKNILFIYMLRFLIIAVGASVAGAVVGSVMAKLLLASVFSPLAISGIPNALLYITISILVVCTIACIILLLSAYKPIKIPPIKAIRSQFADDAKCMGKDNSKIFSKPWRITTKLAWVKLLYNKRRSTMTVCTSLLLSTVLVACFGIYTSAANINTEPQKWGLMKMDVFQIPQGDVDSKEILHELNADPRVAYSYGAHRNALHIKTNPADQYTQVSIETYETPLDPNVKLHYYEGRMPENMQEAAVGYGLAKKMNIKLGDTLYVNKFGNELIVQVTGIYPTFSDGGNAIQMTTNDINAFFDNANLGYYSFVLEDGVNRYTLAESWNEKYGGEFNFLAMQDNAQSMQKLLLPVFLGVMLAISVILSIVIVNITMLKVSEEQKNIGILQANGFSKKNIRKIFLSENIFLALVGAIIGIAIGCFAIPVILAPLMVQFGLAALPYSINIFNILLALLLTIALYGLSTTIATKRISRFEPKELIKVDS